MGILRLFEDKQMLLRSYRFGLGISSLFDFACLNKALSFYEAPQFGYGAAGNCRCRCQCHNADRNGIGTGGVGSRSMSLEPPCQFDNNMMGSRRVSSEDGCVQVGTSGLAWLAINMSWMMACIQLILTSNLNRFFLSELGTANPNFF